MNILNNLKKLINKKKNTMIKKDDITIIEVADLHKELYEQEKSEALKTLLQIMKEDISSLINDNIFVIKFKDKEGTKQSLYELMNNISLYQEDNLKLTKEIIKVFSEYKYANSLEDKEGRAALTDVVSFLLKDENFKFFDVLSKYFNVIDSNKADDLKEELESLDFIYEEVEEYEKFKASLPKIFYLKKETLNQF